VAKGKTRLRLTYGAFDAVNVSWLQEGLAYDEARNQFLRRFLSFKLVVLTLDSYTIGGELPPAAIDEVLSPRRCGSPVWA